MHSRDVTAVGELLVGLQLDGLPETSLNRVALDRVETLGFADSQGGLEEAFIHTPENVDMLVFDLAATEIVA